MVRIVENYEHRTQHSDVENINEIKQTNNTSANNTNGNGYTPTNSRTGLGVLQSIKDAIMNDYVPYAPFIVTDGYGNRMDGIVHTHAHLRKTRGENER